MFSMTHGFLAFVLLFDVICSKLSHEFPYEFPHDWGFNGKNWVESEEQKLADVISYNSLMRVSAQVGSCKKSDSAWDERLGNPKFTPWDV